MEKLAATTSIEAEERARGLSARLKRLWFSVRARLSQTTPECLRYGHRVETVISDRLIFQKGTRPMVDVFSGEYRFCRTYGCSWNSASVSKNGEIDIAQMDAWMKEGR